MPLHVSLNRPSDRNCDHQISLSPSKQKSTINRKGLYCNSGSLWQQLWTHLWSSRLRQIMFNIIKTESDCFPHNKVKKSRNLPGGRNANVIVDSSWRVIAPNDEPIKIDIGIPIKFWCAVCQFFLEKGVFSSTDLIKKSGNFEFAETNRSKNLPKSAKLPDHVSGIIFKFCQFRMSSDSK